MESVLKRSLGRQVLNGIGIVLVLLCAWAAEPAPAGAANRQNFSGHAAHFPGASRKFARAGRLGRWGICSGFRRFHRGYGGRRFFERPFIACARPWLHRRAKVTRWARHFPRADFRPRRAPPLAGSHRTSAPQPGRSNLEVAGFASLAAFGSWTPYNGNHVWIPRDIEAEWRPYTAGRWSFSERYGWLWVSYEPFGWATYHHGRWGHAKEIGWYWVPDERWAPAWVSWRRSARYIAWAPLPPSGAGNQVSANIDCCLIPPDRWTAVPVEHFLDRDLTHVVTRDVIEEAQPIGTVAVEGGVVVNRALSESSVKRQTRKESDRS